MSPLILIGGGGALGILALAIRRPALACALLALAIPLSAGMARGAVVPVLRVNEALLMVVAVGFLVHRLTRWRPLPYSGTDIVVLGFCLLNVLIPWAVILLTRADAALDDWLVVLAPVQYLLVYVVYSRTEFTGADLRLLLNACMFASLPVAAVAGAQAIDLPGVRDLVATYYPTAPQPSWDRVYRPASLLGHYSAVGAFGLLNLMLALVLAATRQAGFPGWWLALVMAANMLSLIASETYAPLAALPVGVVAALLVVRRIPWSHLTAGLPVLGAAAVVLWPSISGRVGSQFSGAGGIALPETLQTRIDYWQGFFIPALLEHGPWLGTGTLIPPEVPRPLVNFVDNGYLWQLFRAGLPGLAALIIMLASVAALAWAMRGSDDPLRRVLGAVCLGGVVTVVMLDTTSEYLTFTGVSQEFWMFVGLLSGAVLAWRSSAAMPVRARAPAAVLAEPTGPAWGGVRARFPLPWRGDWGAVGAPSGAAAVNSGAATLLDQPVAAALPGRLRAALGPWVARRSVIAARLRKAVVDRRNLPRALLWGRRPGFQSRQTSTPPIVAVEVPPLPPPPTSPQCAEVGVIDLEDAVRRSPVTAAAGLLGLQVKGAAYEATASLIDRALAGRWPLIAAAAGSSQPPPASLAAFVGRGGTLYLDALDEQSNPVLRRLGEALDVALPQVRRASTAGDLLFPGDRAAFARELAGTRLRTACGYLALEPAAGEDVLAWSLAAGTRQAVVVRRRAGQGSVVLSVLPRPAASRPADIMESDKAGALVVPLLLLRELYGQAAWHAPAVLANFSIDDPALRSGLLGLRYDLLTAQARDHGFHVTIATVPRELRLAEEAVVRRMRDQPALLSACFHGCDHDGYEFYLSSGTRTPYSSRPLEKQRAALWRAVEHGRRFAAALDHQLDRVMVFPYGLGPASLLRDLHRLGFLATCNFGDKYPLEAPVPAEPDLGLRPADLAWEGFPLLWRRRLSDDGYLLDLLLGRPVLPFAHARELGPDFAPLAERARAINRATHGAAVWRGLDEVARHAYLQRNAPGSGWEVLMTANEACLHNPSREPRTCTVMRPHLPEETVVEVDGVVRDPEMPLHVTVPAGGTAVVRLVAGGAASALPGRVRCTVFGPAAAPARLSPTLEVAR